MELIHMRNPLSILGYNYFKFYWLTKVTWRVLLTGYLVTNLCPALLGVGHDFYFRRLAVPQLSQSHDVSGIMDDDIVQPHGSMECYAGCCACLSHVWTTIPRRCISAP